MIHFDKKTYKTLKKIYDADDKGVRWGDLRKYLAMMACTPFFVTLMQSYIPSIWTKMVIGLP